MKSKDFYIHLGKLLYSIAIADGTVQDEELDELRVLISNELSDDNLFNQDEENVFHTEFEFEVQMNKKTSRNAAFHSFINFLDENSESFTEELVNVTVLAVKRIAKSFDGICDEEQEMIDELNNRIRKLENKVTN